MTLANDCSRPTRGRLRVGHHHHGHLGIPRRGSVQDPMSILKDLNNESNGGGVGFSRKSVSFCQRDNVHVYKSEPYYEDEEDILNLTSLSSKYLLLRFRIEFESNSNRIQIQIEFESNSNRVRIEFKSSSNRVCT